MTKKQDEILSVLSDIKHDLEEQALRIDEIENGMLEITASISADIRTLMKALGVKRKKKKRGDIKRSVPDILAADWPIVEPDAVIQESDQ